MAMRCALFEPRHAAQIDFGKILRCATNLQIQRNLYVKDRQASTKHAAVDRQIPLATELLLERKALRVNIVCQNNRTIFDYTMLNA